MMSGAILTILTLGAAPASKFATDTARRVVQRVEDGEIDWTSGYVRAKGQAVINPDIKNKAQARLMAERAATVVAQRNLLEIIQGVRVNSETVVRDMMAQSDVIVTRVEGVVKNARPVGEPVWDGDMVTVVLEAPLYGQEGISGALAPALKREETGNRAAADSLKDVPCVVVDAHGVKMDPALLPRLVSPDGKLALDLSRLADPNGQPIKYVRDLGDVLQCGEQAVVIRAVDARGAKAKSDLVVDQKDVSKLKWLVDAGKFLWDLGKTLLTIF